MEIFLPLKLKTGLILLIVDPNNEKKYPLDDIVYINLEDEIDIEKQQAKMKMRKEAKKASKVKKKTSKIQNLLEYSGFDDFEVHRVSKRSVNSGINSRRRSLEPVIKLVHTLYVNQTKLSKVASKQANEIQILKTNQQRIGLVE